MKDTIYKILTGIVIFAAGGIMNYFGSNPRILYVPAVAICAWISWVILAGVHTYVSKQEEEKAAERTPTQSVPANALLSEDGRVLTTESSAPASSGTNAAPTSPTPTKEEPTRTTPVAPPQSSATPTTKMTPSQITAEVRAARPFQRDHVIESFVGAPVKWKAFLGSIRRVPVMSQGKLSNEYLSVTLSDEQGTTIFVVVPISGSEALSLLEEGSPILIKGLIGEIGVSWISLGDSSLEII